ncbi:hypothetical protein Cgig2_011658 [Carnegiea gigantea]|uniref:Uncharacterized protein n=1 Tax=Carnegiea gigantea TaxID=171969 RepID=A0A9Q1JQ38_9CARY|nr:hypothetical protein Cgig2_011658 [Carnegiea gigantea]
MEPRKDELGILLTPKKGKSMLGHCESVKKLGLKWRWWFSQLSVHDMEKWTFPSELDTNPIVGRSTKTIVLLTKIYGVSHIVENCCRVMPKVRTNRVKFPKGWEIIEPTLQKLKSKRREDIWMFVNSIVFTTVSIEVYPDVPLVISCDDDNNPFNAWDEDGDNSTDSPSMSLEAEASGNSYTLVYLGILQ